MDERAARIIKSAGGPAALAKLLGLDADRWHLQRINNWKKRGLPSDVELANYEAIKALDEKATAP